MPSSVERKIKFKSGIFFASLGRDASIILFMKRFNELKGCRPFRNKIFKTGINCEYYGLINYRYCLARKIRPCGVPWTM